MSDIGISNQPRELIESRNLNRAGTGQPLLHASKCGLRQNPPHRPDDPLTVGVCSRLRVDVQCEQAAHSRNRSRQVGERHAKDLVEI